jgi:3-oxoacyl-[acyl-carrier-protein] synthase-1
MSVAITSVGLATAQGSAAEIAAGATPRPPEPWPWPLNGWTTSQRCRPAAGLSPNLTGVARWQALIQLALADCLGDQPDAANSPILLASCNGSAHGFDLESWSRAFDSAVLLEGTRWAGRRAPVFSSSCNSGLHALFAAKQILLAGQANEAVVVAVDILSRSNQDNFEALRVLTNSPMRPWQTTNDGFILGEAAVALKLVRAPDGVCARLTGPVLGNELKRDDGLARVLEQLSAANPQLLLGQGTGPFANDEAELAAFRNCVSPDVPLATSLVHFGHTLGASGLLSIALAALSEQYAQAISTFAMPTSQASDGRPLHTGDAGNNVGRTGNVLVSCRALNGSCAAAVVSRAREVSTPEPDPQLEEVWHAPVPTGPLMHGTLRQLAAEALAQRPSAPPDLLVVNLEEPLAPPPQASIGGRLLPSAVLEMTPGFVSQLIARCWGFAGPALCLVGASDAEDEAADLAAAGGQRGMGIAPLQKRGTGDKREITWNT